VVLIPALGTFDENIHVVSLSSNPAEMNFWRDPQAGMAQQKL
jgi:hypothetical protein